MLKKPSGFTTIELLIVLAIIGIAAALAISVFGGTPRVRLKDAARTIVSDMQVARIKAFEQSVPWAIQFDPGNKQYTLGVLEPGPDGQLYTKDDVIREAGKKTVKLTINYSGISFGSEQGERPGDKVTSDGVTFENDRVIFRPDGSSTFGTVYVKNIGGETIAVGTNAAAGMIRTWQNFGSGWGG